MMWKDCDRIYSELSDGKQHLENLLNCEISVFVAPNNHIDKKGISALDRLGMNFSGIIGFHDRKITPRYIANFISRWIYRAINKLQSPKIYNFGRHQELCAYSIDSVDRLKKDYAECKRLGVPFVVYTHYWSINADERQKDILREIYKHAIDDGAELVPLSKCFE